MRRARPWRRAQCQPLLRSRPSSNVRVMITFVTSNAGKFKRFTEELAPFGLTAAQQTLNIAEPQESSIPDVARHKAQVAYQMLGRPVVVEDSGLCIPALNNFPEALTKPVLTRVGLDGLLTMLAAIEDRRCFFISALGYADAEGNVDVIVSRHETGTLMRAPSGQNFAQSWSALSHIFVPDGFDKTMAAMTPDEHAQLYDQWRPHNIFCAFAQLASAERQRFGLLNAA